MSNISANYTALPLSGTMGEGELGDGISGTSVHRLLCISTSGSATVTAKGGGTFTWTANQSEFIDVVVKKVTINSGDFIGFKAKFFGDQSFPYHK